METIAPTGTALRPEEPAVDLDTALQRLRDEAARNAAMLAATASVLNQQRPAVSVPRQASPAVAPQAVKTTAVTDAPTPIRAASTADAQPLQAAQPVQSVQTVATPTAAPAPVPANPPRRTTGSPVKLLSVFATVFLASSFILGISGNRDSSGVATQLVIAADSMMHAQRLAGAAEHALSGTQSAFDQLQDSRRYLDAAASALVQGGDVGGATIQAVDVAVVENVEDLLAIWRTITGNLDIVIDRQSTLATLAQMRTLVEGQSNALDAIADELATVLASPGRVASKADLVALQVFRGRLDHLNREWHAIVLPADRPGSPNETGLGTALVRLGNQLNALYDGDSKLGLAPIAHPAAQPLLRALAAAYAPLVDPVLNMADSLSGLDRARESVRKTIESAERFQAEIARTQQRLLQARDALRDQQWLALALFAAGALTLILMGSMLSTASRQRAAQAERERAQAEVLEARAKQLNTQNQQAILRLMNELQKVADGDLTVQATVSDDITGAIADSINYTIEELRSLVGRINETADSVSVASGRAELIATGLQAASDQQSREIRDTGKSVLDMAGRIKSVSESAAESVQVANATLEAADRGHRAVENSIAGMHLIRDHIRETSKRIKRLGESSQEIGEIVELISDITDKTKLLSLNAAIQAASAGEAGRGFSVVAQEVQKLAERSARATLDISALIKAIQADAQDAIAAMERSTQGVVDGKKLSDEAGSALTGIGKVSRELADLISRISMTTAHESRSAQDVASSIQRILMVTEQTGAGTRQTADSIKRLAELAGELKNSVARFRVQA